MKREEKAFAYRECYAEARKEFGRLYISGLTTEEQHSRIRKRAKEIYKERMKPSRS